MTSHNDKNVVPDWSNGQIHGWNGGDCPVHPETEAQVWFRGIMPDHGAAYTFEWDHVGNGDDGDIIAFRVVKQHVEPKVIWVNEYEDGHHTAHNTEEKAKHSAKGLSLRLTRIAVKYVEVKE